MTDSPTRVRLNFVLAVLAIAGAAWIAGITLLPRAQAPLVHWQVGPDRQTPEPFARVARFDAMSLSVELPFPAFVYVVSFDHVQGTVTYFPSEFLGTDLDDHATGKMHQLAAGRHQIPGTWDDKPIEWFVPGIEESLSLCVVISRTALVELEEILPLTRQVGNRAYPDRSMGSYMPRAGRDKVQGRRRMPHPALQAALDGAASQTEGRALPWPGHPGIFLSTQQLVPGKPRPGRSAPGNPFAEQLKDTVDQKQSAK